MRKIIACFYGAGNDPAEQEERTQERARGETAGELSLSRERGWDTRA